MSGDIEGVWKLSVISAQFTVNLKLLLKIVD